MDFFESIGNFVSTGFDSVANFFTGGGIGGGDVGVDSDIWSFDPNPISGAIDPWEGGMSGGIGDIFDPGTLQNFDVSGVTGEAGATIDLLNMPEGMGVFDYGSPAVAAYEAAGLLGASGFIDSFGAGAKMMGPGGKAIPATAKSAAQAATKQATQQATKQQTGTSDKPKGGSYTSPAQALRDSKGLAEKLSFYGPTTAQSKMQRVGAASQLGKKAGEGGYKGSSIHDYYKYLIDKQAMTPKTTSTLQTKYALK